VTILTGERTGDSISDMTGWDRDRTNDMIGNRAWDRTGPGLMTGLVREPATESANRLQIWQI
jgi:hypothetical protein